jgi:chromosome segregation protein
MQLKKIKLSGFKSFVDPTTIMLPSNMVAVVGPNGCGKSNVIDAVSWVMGESSAKYLRGESLTDVIFNGSTSRKPVGLATVELIFDNQDGTVGGEYASYAEISIRRQITREGDSTYYLNGTRCRRRDIIDIFLGTGLGPRGYSIIGQNMISRIIEARPDDMRVYLEEAAGVSKYKERRRETENRINHTKENLARLGDVRTELDKQLGTLQRQANAAEKFKILKQEERVTRAQWHVVQWRELDSQIVDFSLQSQQMETGLEARQADLVNTDLSLEQRRNDQRSSGEIFQEIQKRYYTAGNEVTRLEQDVRYHQEKQRQWQSDIQQVNSDCQEVIGQIEEVEEELQELTIDLDRLGPESEAAKEQALELIQELAAAEEALQSWQSRWDEFNQRAAKSTQTAQVEQTRIQHLEQKLSSIKQRQVKLEQDQGQINFSDLEMEIESLSEQLLDVTDQTEEHNTQLTHFSQQLNAFRTSQQQTTSRLDEVRNEIQRLHGQQASLEALQQTALGQRNNRVVQWLEKNQLDKHPRLAQGIEVAAGWDKAVERVLGSYLQAVCVDNFSDVIAKTSEFDEGSLCFFTHSSSSTVASNADTLLSKVKSKWPLESLLAHVYIAENEAAALKLSETLAAHESVITPDGLWMSSSWIRISRDENPESGVFQREQELKLLAQQIEELTIQRDELEESLEQIRDQLKETESQREELQKVANQTHVQSAELRAQQKTKQERIKELQARAERYRQELDDCIAQHEEAQADLTQARFVWQQAMQELESQADQRDALTQERESTREAVQSRRMQANQAKDQSHQLEIRCQTTRSQHASQKQTLTRMQTQLASLNERMATLQHELDAFTSTEELEECLAEALNKRLKIEEELSEARMTLESIDMELRGLDSRRQEAERDVNRLRDKLETLRLEWRELKVKSETQVEQVKETGFLFEDILKELPEEISAQAWQAQLEQITLRITRLGAINLVAIEEYASCSERKEYLDSQCHDLQEGLATLESAIEKIDKETRARFKDTFDKVNSYFQDLFPKIFGGGRAYLELTGENLLDSGITVMACPPGKRNSTIHLLSGGEKAMTAIALVFSIFQLNPAPFCLLDEVDAPLDDANVGRFCSLVKMMSDKTQFIFISHNKLAIEMGEHLIGVTMHEPGVSRLVTVDMKEAMTLAGV